jgi:hypothetical protein
VTGTLEATWGMSLLCEAGLALQLRNRKVIPVFFTYLVVDIVTSVSLYSVAMLRPDLYEQMWIPAQIFILLIRAAMTIEAIIGMKLSERLSRELMLGVLLAGAGVSVIAGWLLSPPLIWPGSALEPMFIGIAVSSLAQGATLIFLCCAAGGLDDMPTRHAALLGAYHCLNAACYFVASHAQVSVVLLAGVGFCYVIWGFLVAHDR